MSSESFLFICSKTEKINHSSSNLEELVSNNQYFAAKQFERGAEVIKYKKGMGSIGINDGAQYLEVTWNCLQQSLYIKNDFFAVFPCYYYEDSDCFVCSDSIELITSVKGLDLELDRLKLIEYISSENVDSVRTVYRRIKKLPPFSILSFCENTLSIQSGDLQLEDNELNFKNVESIAEIFKNSLFESLRCLSNCDSLAVELSGGLDSSAVYSIVKNSCPDIFSLAIDFGNLSCSESEYRRHLLGSSVNNHFELSAEYVQPKELISIASLEKDFPDFPNSYLARVLYKFASKNNKQFILSGFGGDQLLSSGQWNKEVPGLISKVPEKLKSIFRKQKYFPWLKNEGIDYITAGIENLNHKLHTLDFNPYQKALLYNVWHPHTLDTLALAQRAANKYGLCKIHPLLNPTLLKLIFNNTYVLKTENYKMILKEAMKDLWPVQLLERQTKAEFSEVYYQTLRNSDYQHIFHKGIEHFEPLIKADEYRYFWKQLQDNKPDTPFYLIWNLIALEVFCASQ